MDLQSDLSAGSEPHTRTGKDVGQRDEAISLGRS